MQPTTETDDYLEYVLDTQTYRISKTNPQVVTVVADFSNVSLCDQPQTWAELKVVFDTMGEQ